jgi:hypothetical protein
MSAIFFAKDPPRALHHRPHDLVFVIREASCRACTHTYVVRPLIGDNTLSGGGVDLRCRLVHILVT